MKTVEYVMEKLGLERPMEAIDLIRNAFRDMELQSPENVVVSTSDMIANQRSYALPSDLLKFVSLSILNEDPKSEILETNDRTFAAASNWTNVDFATYDETTDLSVTNTASGQYCYLNDDSIMTVGKRYRLVYDATISTGSFALKSYTGGVTYGTFVNGTSKYMEFTALEADKLKIVATSASGGADFDNFSLKEIGNTEYRKVSRVIGALSEVWGDDKVAVGATTSTVTVASSTFADGDTTPSVAGGTLFYTANTAPTTITTFDDGVDGQIITVFFEDANTTIDSGTDIVMPGGIDMTFQSGDLATFVYRTGVWYGYVSRIG